MKTAKSSDDEFVYLGITPTFNLYLKKTFFKKCILENNNLIQLSFNVNGIILFNSSNEQFWPILCRVHINSIDIEPFVVRIFYSDLKPFSVCKYLNEFEQNTV